MLPEIPHVPHRSCGFRLGGIWNAIVTRLDRQKLLTSATVKVSNTDRGQILDVIGAASDVGALGLGFEVSHTGVAVEVAAGKVLTQTWSGASGSDFKPSDWTTESNFVGTTLSSSATEVWLQVQFTESDTDSEGALGTESIDLSGAAGGRGGGGGGGGASNESLVTHYVTAGETGEDGILTGAGGAGGGVYELDDDPATHSGGYGADGGSGGAGGAGGDGSTVSFTRPTKGIVRVRHYTLSSISAHTSKGTASELATWVQLASIASGVVTQHHIGTLRLTPAAPTFLEP